VDTTHGDDTHGLDHGAVTLDPSNRRTLTTLNFCGVKLPVTLDFSFVFEFVAANEERFAVAPF
jgi:hypothetical protein